MSLWIFTAVEDLAEATDYGSSVLLWQKQRHFPRSLMPKMLYIKWLCIEMPAEKWSSSQLHPPSSHCHPRDQDWQWLRTKSSNANRRNGKDQQHEIIKELGHLLSCSNTNISSWPGGLQHNRAKEGFTGIDSHSYQVSYELKSQAGQAWVGSGWLIFKCPDRVQLVIIKSWTATMWAVLSGYLYMPDWFPAVCNSAWQHLKKGYDQVPCIDK